jgi:hypothetical protein
MALLLPAGLAWGCVAVVSLTTSSPTVQPGGTVTVIAREFASNVPVIVRLDSPTGPVLGQATPTATMNSKTDIPVQIPADTRPGEHFFFASQDHHDMNSGQPARAAIYVGVSPPPTAAPEVRPIGLESDSGPSAAVLIGIALIVAVVALGLVGLWAALGSKRGSGGTEGATPATPAGAAS